MPLASPVHQELCSSKSYWLWPKDSRKHSNIPLESLHGKLRLLGSLALLMAGQSPCMPMLGT